jgi:chorismate mutase
MRGELRRKRAKIDLIDEKISRLLARRFVLALSLKGLKKTTVDTAREKEVLARAQKHAGRAAFREPVKNIFEGIISQTKRLQRNKW